MKKTVTLPDGSVEVVEGTAEEVAAYEKAKGREHANEGSRSKKKILLSEETGQELKKGLGLLLDELTKAHTCAIGCVCHWHWWLYPTYPNVAPLQPYVDPIDPSIPYVQPVWIAPTTTDQIPAIYHSPNTTGILDPSFGTVITD